MTTLIDIPAVAAFHLPTPASSPLPLSSGDLSLVLLPAAPPTTPAETLTLNVGSSSFPLTKRYPVQKVQSKDEHPTYAFGVQAPEAGASVGQVRITMKHSTNPGEWEATEAFCTRLEAILKEHGLWKAEILFVDDEYETGGSPAVKKGWGESLADSLVSGGQSLATKIHGYADKHVKTTEPGTTVEPTRGEVESAKSFSHTTSSIAASASDGATAVGNAVHSAGSSVASALPNSAKIDRDLPEAEKWQIRKAAESGWEQVTFAAKGVAEAATTVGGAISSGGHQAIQHNAGKEADDVAQDIGQSGSNLASTVGSGLKTTSIAAQGGNATSGFASGTYATKPAAGALP
ncbi:hypothetical protein L202_05904 [Cryptococcus amylolentus CBS 6039]|uniref:Senescence domain-containing protein n=2 Tax=Cryptococcus amylolentus TaxID=104669 RepID=A0A1E3HHU6_9TREE|nr:hypothetical protein L202_05904 [Cryptococcus amylolentus CBS 6039]ODN75920.1 hypothetical protein L202_05904 [Cryptococcus amylolentus CBS 6039]ODN97062.1 hypothetical protein I350_08041 [Cryptococcus amylolentus CBS 6273]